MKIFEEIKDIPNDSPSSDVAALLNQGIMILNNYHRFEVGKDAKAIADSAAEAKKDTQATDMSKIKKTVDQLKEFMPQEYEIRARENNYAILSDEARLKKLVEQKYKNDAEKKEEALKEIKKLHQQVEQFGPFLVLKANQLATAADMMDIIIKKISEELSNIKKDDPLKKTIEQKLQEMKEKRTNIVALMLEHIKMAIKNGSIKIKIIDPTGNNSILETSFIDMQPAEKIDCNVLESLNLQSYEILGIQESYKSHTSDNTMKKPPSPHTMRKEPMGVLLNGLSPTENYFIFYIMQHGSNEQKEKITGLYSDKTARETYQKITSDQYTQFEKLCQYVPSLPTLGVIGKFFYNYLFVPSYNSVAFTMNVLNDIYQGDGLKEVHELRAAYNDKYNDKKREEELEKLRENLQKANGRWEKLRGHLQNPGQEPPTDDLFDDWIIVDEKLVEQKNTSLLSFVVNFASNLTSALQNKINSFRGKNEFSQNLEKIDKLMEDIEKIQLPENLEKGWALIDKLEEGWTSVAKLEEQWVLMEQKAKEEEEEEQKKQKQEEEQQHEVTIEISNDIINLGEEIITNPFFATTNRVIDLELSNRAEEEPLLIEDNQNYSDLIKKATKLCTDYLKYSEKFIKKDEIAGEKWKAVRNLKEILEHTQSNSKTIITDFKREIDDIIKDMKENPEHLFHKHRDSGFTQFLKEAAKLLADCIPSLKKFAFFSTKPRSEILVEKASELVKNIKP